MLIASVAFIGPRVLNDMVVKPVGGISMEADVGLNCDGILKNQLVFQRAASTSDRMNVIISQIQNNWEECNSDVWSPVASSDPAGNNCWTTTKKLGLATNKTIGEGVIPDGLKTGGGSGAPRHSSGRDADNNILVYWGLASDRRPSDRASCWLYLARLRAWHQNYYE